jgi:hypothetical protein
MALAAAAPSNAGGLTIVPTFDPTIAASADAAQIEAAITQVDQTYSRLYANNVTVNIDFQLGDLGVNGGRSHSTGYILSYTDDEHGFLAFDSATHPQNLVLATAQANLAFGNVAPYIITTSANLRALGASGAVGLLDANGAHNGSFDGIVQLDAASVQDGAYAFTSTVGPNQYPGIDVLYHEIDEVLGIGGSGSTLNAIADGFFAPGFAIGPLDPYRYDLYTGLPSFTTQPDEPNLPGDPPAYTYFSIDGGKTGVAYFNQFPVGDYGDYGRFACNDGLQSIQEWSGCNGEPSLPLTAAGPESIALQSIGYDLAPEPATWAMLFLGLFGTGLALRRRRDAVAMI